MRNYPNHQIPDLEKLLADIDRQNVLGFRQSSTRFVRASKAPTLHDPERLDNWARLSELLHRGEFSSSFGDDDVVVCGLLIPDGLHDLLQRLTVEQIHRQIVCHDARMLAERLIHPSVVDVDCIGPIRAAARKLLRKIDPYDYDLDPEKYDRLWQTVIADYSGVEETVLAVPSRRWAYRYGRTRDEEFGLSDNGYHFDVPYYYFLRSEVSGERAFNPQYDDGLMAAWTALAAGSI